MHLVNGSSPPVAEWSLMADDSGYRLPPAPKQKVASSNTQMWDSNHTAPTTTQSMGMPMDTAAMSIWDTYSNDFSILNEPWLGNEAEFAAVCGPRQQMQMMYPDMAAGYIGSSFDETHFGV